MTSKTSGSVFSFLLFGVGERLGTKKNNKDVGFHTPMYQWFSPTTTTAAAITAGKSDNNRRHIRQIINNFKSRLTVRLPEMMNLPLGIHVLSIYAFWNTGCCCCLCVCVDLLGYIDQGHIVLCLSVRPSVCRHLTLYFHLFMLYHLCLVCISIYDLDPAWNIAFYKHIVHLVLNQWLNGWQQMKFIHR